jgi:hypothetical protein
VVAADPVTRHRTGVIIVPHTNRGADMDRKAWPLWVRLGLWGLKNRFAAWGFVWLSLFLAATSIVVADFYPPASAGRLLVFAALWYYLAIRWVDRHGGW